MEPGGNIDSKIFNVAWLKWYKMTGVGTCSKLVKLRI